MFGKYFSLQLNPEPNALLNGPPLVQDAPKWHLIPFLVSYFWPGNIGARYSFWVPVFFFNQYSIWGASTQAVENSRLQYFCTRPNSITPLFMPHIFINFLLVWRWLMMETGGWMQCLAVVMVLYLGKSNNGENSFLRTVRSPSLPGSCNM